MSTPPDRWDGALYARHSTLQEAMADEVLARLRLAGDERLLDVGSGDGRVSARIAAGHVPRGVVVGIDASADMVMFASRTHADIVNLSFEVADARDLGFDGAFDAAVSFNALHWVPQIDRALASLRRAVLRRAPVWLRLVTQGERTSLETIAESIRRQPSWAASFESFEDPYLRLSPDALAGRCRTAGFDVVDETTRLASWDFPTREAFFGFCQAGFGAWTGRLPPERRTDFIDAVVDGYFALPDASPDEFRFRFYQTDLTLAAA